MTTMTNNWERFFDAHAPEYMDNVFVKNTLQEVDFLVAELSLRPGDSILDVGCGTGRHSIELAKRGYAVTGLDLSAQMLEQARRGAKAAGVEVNWVHADAARFSLPDKYDAGIGLCEGSLGLLGQTDDLKPEGQAILTVLNGAAMIRKYTNDDVAGGRFDPLRMVESSEYSPREGLPPIPVQERAFVPTELVLMCRLAGMAVTHIWGGTAGNWGRRSVDLDEIEIMIVARKTAEPRHGSHP